MTSPESAAPGSSPGAVAGGPQVPERHWATRQPDRRWKMRVTENHRPGFLCKWCLLSFIHRWNFVGWHRLVFWSRILSSESLLGVVICFNLMLFLTCLTDHWDGKLTAKSLLFFLRYSIPLFFFTGSCVNIYRSLILNKNLCFFLISKMARKHWAHNTCWRGAPITLQARFKLPAWLALRHLSL